MSPGDQPFWDVLWTMPTWHLLVSLDERPFGAVPPLFVARFGADPSPLADAPRFACVFTSAERGQRATTPEFLPLQPGRRAVIHLDRDRACDMLCASPLVDAMCVNADELVCAHWISLAEMAVEYERRFERLTPRMFGWFGAAVNRGGQPLRQRLVRRLLDAPEWWFVATEARRTAPALVGMASEAFVVPIFTDAEMARRAGPAIVAPLDEGEAVALPMAPRDGTSFLRRLHERGRRDARAVIVNDVPGESGEPAAIPLVEMLDAADALRW